MPSLLWALGWCERGEDNADSAEVVFEFVVAFAGCASLDDVDGVDPRVRPFAVGLERLWDKRASSTTSFHSRVVTSRYLFP